MMMMMMMMMTRTTTTTRTRISSYNRSSSSSRSNKMTLFAVVFSSTMLSVIMMMMMMMMMMGVHVDAFAFHHGVLLLSTQRINSAADTGAGTGLFMSTTDASSQKSENSDNDNNNHSMSRRSLWTETAATAAALVTTALSTAAFSPEEAAFAEDTTGSSPQVRGIPVTPFNGLMFNYRGFDYGGLTADQVNNEPSISYQEFINKLKAGDVEFVEFLAPDGDAAYATFKNNKQPIRIGEGYPIEQHDGWSSPAFAIRAVKNAGVPFTFTVPALSKYRS